MRTISKKDVTLVLVHAQGLDRSSWDKVRTDLEGRGHQVVVASIPMTSFADDVETVRRLLQKQTGAVVLAAHSYTGAVIAAAAAGDHKVKGLVHVYAILPEGGESAKRVSFPLRDRTLRLTAHEIDWMSAEDNYVQIYRGKEHLLVRTTLSKLEKAFQSPALLRVHRSYMVNINRVQEIRRSHNGHLWPLHHCPQGRYQHYVQPPIQTPAAFSPPPLGDSLFSLVPRKDGGASLLRRKPLTKLVA